MARGLARLDAADTLAATEAAALGSGFSKSAPSRLRELAAIAAGDREPSDGLPSTPWEVMARLQELNARARERGDLWEQRVERGEVVPLG